MFLLYHNHGALLLSPQPKWSFTLHVWWAGCAAVYPVKWLLEHKNVVGWIILTDGRFCPHCSSNLQIIQALHTLSFMHCIAVCINLNCPFAQAKTNNRPLTYHSESVRYILAGDAGGSTFSASESFCLRHIIRYIKVDLFCIYNGCISLC